MAAHSDSVEIKRLFQKGDVVRFKYEFHDQEKTELPGGIGAQEVTSTGSADVEQTIESLEADGRGNIKTELKNIKLDVKSVVGNPLDTPPNSVMIRSKLDARNQFQDFTSDAGAKKMFKAGEARTMPIFSYSFPDHPVRIGDSWDSQVPKMGSKELTSLKTTLTGDKMERGVSVWVLHLEGDLPYDGVKTKFDSGPLQGEEVTVSGKVHSDSTIEVEKTTGVLVTLGSHTSSETTVTLESMGLTITSKGNGEVTFNRES
jgi:hypothetical protein